ncbi:MAG: hypothetical protein V1837_01795 [Candidatus Woesearchaeota archaeon]
MYKILAAGAVFILLLLGCAAPITCPLQQIQNTSCKECPVCEKCPVQDINSCPKITIVQNNTYTKYVCPNGMVVEDVDRCFPVLTTNLTPVLTNENGSYIQSVTVNPACVYGVNGGVIFFRLGTIASNVTVQVKSDSDYNDVDISHNLGTGFIYFVISDKLGQADFMLQRNKVYLLRVQFLLPALNSTQYSNEHIVDTRSGSIYTVKKCS